MNQPDREQSDLSRLFDDWCEQSITEQDASRLNDILAEDAAARREFLRHLEIHALLSLGDGKLARMWADSEVQRAPRRAPGAALVGAVKNIRNFFSRPTPLSLSTAAAVIGLVITAMAFMAPPFYRALVGRRGSEQRESPIIVARLTGVRTVVWSDGQTIRKGAHLAQGRVVSLQSGLAEVTMTSGARLILEGPTTIDLSDENSAHLEQGRVFVHVPAQAVGFRLTSPAAEFVDLGTEFGVYLNANGRGGSRVEAGSVRVKPQAKSQEPFLLTAGQSIRFDVAQGQLNRADFDMEFARQMPPNAEIIGRWPFDQGASGPLAEASGRFRAARVVPESFEPAIVQGRFGDALSANGQVGGVTIQNVLPASFTLSLWIKTDAPTAAGELAYAGNALLWADVPGEGNDFVLALLNDRLAFHDGAATRELRKDAFTWGATRLNDGQWHHVALTRDRGQAEAGVRLYVDGELDGTGAAGTARLIANPRICVGFSLDRNAAHRNHFRGAMDELCLFSSALSAEEIASLFEHGSEALATHSE